MVVTECLIPECYIDTNLVETVSFTGCNHQKSCSMVAGTMQRKQRSCRHQTIYVAWHSVAILGGAQLHLRPGSPQTAVPVSE